MRHLIKTLFIFLISNSHNYVKGGKYYNYLCKSTTNIMFYNDMNL